MIKYQFGLSVFRNREGNAMRRYDNDVINSNFFSSINYKKRGRAGLIFSLVLLFVLTVSTVGAAILIPFDQVHAENITGAENDKVNIDFTGQNEGYSAVLYNNSNGLPTSEANAIAETAEGFIWIGSYSGLIRYDGNTFERIENVSGISSVTALYVDSKNRLWIGSNDNGTAMMDKGEFKFFRDETGFQSLSIRSITEDKAGNILLATTHGVNVIDEYQNLYKLDSPNINDAYIHELRTDDSTGIIYGITQEGYVFTIENCKVTGYFDLTRFGIESANCILPDPNNPGYVYVGTDYSEVYYGNLQDGMSNAKLIEVKPLSKINSMEFIDGKLWICSDTGIGMHDGAGFRQIYNLPMNNSIDQMLTDYEGNLWFASSRQGVLKVVRNRFTDIFAKYGLEETVVNSTCRYKSYLLLGTDQGLIALEGGTTASKISLKQKIDLPEEYQNCTNLIELLDGIRIRSIIRDSEDILWISTYSELGLLEFDDGNIRCYNLNNGMPSNKARTVYEVPEAGYIFAACSEGLALIDKKSGITDVIDTDSGLGNPEVLTATSGFNGEIVIGTDGGGIYIVRNTNIQGIGLKDGLSSMVVMRIKRDDARRVYWIVTSNSLSYMTEDYEIVTIKNFPYTNNFDLYENDKGEMWVLSSNGVYVASIDELIANEEINTTYFSMASGLSCVSTANSYSELTEDGDLYIAGSTGVSKVNINKTFGDVENIKLTVPYVEADGKMLYPDESGTITVPSSVKRVTIYGYVFTYSLMNPNVTYYLEGFDKEPKTVKRSDFEPVAYTNLKGKTYNFVMKLDDSMGTGNNEASITIIKKKAFYESILFYVFVAVVFGLLLYEVIAFFVNKKTESYLKKQKETNLFIREMTEAFARTIDMKDQYTKGHSIRVAEYTAKLTRELGYDEDTVEKYYNIALLHDIGKIGIKPEVLNKAGKLTDEEFTLIKSHSTKGYHVLKDISIMPELATGARFHHERPDGKGYPKGLVGDEIPRVAQIIAVADTFDAMYSNRPYRKRMNFERVVSIIKEVSGTQLTEDVVDAFLRLVEKGELKMDADDDGGGSMDDINNIRRKYEDNADKKEENKENKEAEKKEDNKDDSVKETKEETGDEKK